MISGGAALPSFGPDALITAAGDLIKQSLSIGLG